MFARLLLLPKTGQTVTYNTSRGRETYAADSYFTDGSTVEAHDSRAWDPNWKYKNHYWDAYRVFKGSLGTHDAAAAQALSSNSRFWTDAREPPFFNQITKNLIEVLRTTYLLLRNAGEKIGNRNGLGEWSDRARKIIDRFRFNDREHDAAFISAMYSY